jgi:hypothetical protein
MNKIISTAMIVAGYFLCGIAGGLCDNKNLSYLIMAQLGIILIMARR